MPEIIRTLVFALSGAAAFWGTLSVIAALTPRRPLPIDALVGAGCVTFIVLVIVVALYEERR